MCMYEGLFKNMQHLYLHGSHKILWDKSLISDAIRMNKFPVCLSHPCMYGRSNIRVLGGVVELGTRALLARGMASASL